VFDVLVGLEVRAQLPGDLELFIADMTVELSQVWCFMLRLLVFGDVRLVDAVIAAVGTTVRSLPPVSVHVLHEMAPGVGLLAALWAGEPPLGVLVRRYVLAESRHALRHELEIAQSAGKLWTWSFQEMSWIFFSMFSKFANIKPLLAVTTHKLLRLL